MSHTRTVGQSEEMGGECQVFVNDSVCPWDRDTFIRNCMVKGDQCKDLRSNKASRVPSVASSYALCEVTESFTHLLTQKWKCGLRGPSTLKYCINVGIYFLLQKTFNSVRTKSQLKQVASFCLISTSR